MLRESRIQLLICACLYAVLLAARAPGQEDGKTEGEETATEEGVEAVSTPEPGDSVEPEPSDAETLPMLRCGTVLDVTVTDEAVPWRDLDAMLRQGRFEPTEEDDSSLVEREPCEGRSYVIVSVKLAEGRTLGKYDYKLVSGDESFVCLAASRDRVPFDPRTWVYEYENDTAVIKLLYEVPSGVEDMALAMALPVTLHQPDVVVRGGEADEEGGTGETKAPPAASAGSSPAPAPKKQVSQAKKPAADATTTGKEDKGGKPAETAPKPKAGQKPAEPAAKPVADKPAKPAEKKPADAKKDSVLDNWR